MKLLSASDIDFAELIKTFKIQIKVFRMQITRAFMEETLLWRKIGSTASLPL